MTNVILGVSGSIAAYKAADIASKLTQKKYTVYVSMTKNATKLISPLTFSSLTKNRVRVDVMTDSDNDYISHINSTKDAELLIIAPATANIIAKIAHGIADDMITTQALSISKDASKLIAPAMNDNMYLNPVTQNNLELLKKYGWKIIMPKVSWLACGKEALGALADVEVIIDAIDEELSKKAINV